MKLKGVAHAKFWVFASSPSILKDLSIRGESASDLVSVLSSKIDDGLIEVSVSGSTTELVAPRVLLAVDHDGRFLRRIVLN